MYWAVFGMVTNNQPTEQLGEPSASLLLTSMRRQSFAIVSLGVAARAGWLKLHSGWFIMSFKNILKHVSSPNFIYPCPRLSFPKLIILGGGRDR